jgi:hypothetical protein
MAGGPRYLLYDPATNRFVYNSFLSGLTMPEVHPQDKTVISFYHMSAGLFSCVRQPPGKGLLGVSS